MLDAVAHPGLMGTAPNPFAKWREGTDGDYHAMFIELWAYLADVLTFYQERIANEAFITTATQRDSLLRLAALIDYDSSPAQAPLRWWRSRSSSSTEITVPAQFRVGSRAQPGQVAAVFETTSAMTARGDYSAIPLAAVAPTNQFAPLRSLGFFFAPSSNDWPELTRAAEHIYGTGWGGLSARAAPRLARARR